MNLPLSSGGSDTNHHYSGISQYLLEVLIVFTFIQTIPQLLQHRNMLKLLV